MPPQTILPPQRVFRRGESDPEMHRMSMGDHLEELRIRLVLALLGFAVAAIGCFVFGERVIAIFVRPLFKAMQSAGISPHINYTQASDPFMVYMEISLIVAGAIASPWIIYQLWKFVAAGLYPRERRAVTRYLPLSIGLLVGGMLFLYFYVLPVSLEFFFRFNSGLPLTAPAMQIDVPSPSTSPTTIPVLKEDPPNPGENTFWVDAAHLQAKAHFGGTTYIVPLSQDALATSIITLPQYIDTVVSMLLAFGFSFQLPLVVLALVRVGIVEIEVLKKWRRIVYFIIAIIAACIIPDVVTGMVALMLPLIFLYELGILLARRGKGAAARE